MCKIFSRNSDLFSSYNKQWKPIEKRSDYALGRTIDMSNFSNCVDILGILGKIIHHLLCQVIIFHVQTRIRLIISIFKAKITKIHTFLYGYDRFYQCKE